MVLIRLDLVSKNINIVWTADFSEQTILIDRSKIIRVLSNLVTNAIKAVKGHDDPKITVGVTVMVAVIGELVLLVAVKAAILPVPDAARPMAVLLLVQLNTVPATAPLKVIAAVVAPLQTV